MEAWPSMKVEGAGGINNGQHVANRSHFSLPWMSPLIFPYSTILSYFSFCTGENYGSLLSSLLLPYL
jgi:hypothetical protein